MELRQKDEARDIDRNDMRLRPIYDVGMRGGRAVYTSAKYAGRGVSKVGKFASNTVKYYSLEREGRQAVKYLSSEQKRQWNSYSRHEQERILKTVDARVERRMRFRNESISGLSQTERRPDRESTTRAYRQPEKSSGTVSGSYSAGSLRKIDTSGINYGGDIRHRGSDNKADNKALIIRNAGANKSDEARDVGNTMRANNKKVVRSETGTSCEYININPYVSSSTLKNVRQKRAQDDFRGQNGNTPPRLKEAPLPGSCKEPLNGQMMQGKAELRKMYINRIENGSAENKGIRLKQELDHLAGGPDGHRQTIHTIPAVQNDRRRSEEKVFYTPDKKKANRVFQKEKRRIRKAQKKEMAARSSMFRSELIGMIDKDMRKQTEMNRMMRVEAMELSQLERETASGALSMVLIPARFEGARVSARIKQQLVKAGTTFLKYAALFGGILFIIVFIVMLFAAILSGISSETEGSSGTYSVSGSAIVEYAQSWINITQYVYGAGRSYDTDWQDYSDCSSFVHGVFSYFGISIGSSTYAMESNGTVVGTNSLENAVAGDIILFYSPTIASGNSYHVGIYAGNGEMVHNSTSKGCVIQAPVTYSGSVYEVRRIVSGASTGNSIDSTDYTLDQLQTIWAIVCQEDGGSYEGALAVISTAMNRVDSPRWVSYGSNAYAQLTASGQFCYSIDSNWKKYLGGNVPDYVKQAVSDCLDSGIRNHCYTSFRAYYTEGSVQIGGGNYYF